MKTSDLVTLLAQSPPPKKPLSFTVVLLALLAATIALTLLILGLRPNLAVAGPTALHKTLLLSMTAWTAGWLLQHAARPVPNYRRLHFYFWPLIVLYLGSILFEFGTTPWPQILASFYTENFPDCLFFVTLYGAAGAWPLFWLMRFYAPHDSKTAGMLIGFSAATTGAVGYSLHCPIDSPVFITIAYGLPVLLLSLVMRKVADKFIRW